MHIDLVALSLAPLVNGVAVALVRVRYLSQFNQSFKFFASVVFFSENFIHFDPSHRRKVKFPSALAQLGPIFQPALAVG